jgi:hypothetical protein
MRKALIENGVVTNVIEADEGFTIEGKTLVEAGTASIGWLWDGETISAPQPPMPTATEVIAERARRFELGFDYDFGDARGVHHIGTTPEDLAGWDEVTTLSNALINLSNGSATIDIVTNTGPATVTATEWQSILIAAGTFRQPIWAASFVLQATDPIPVDFADDSYWP